MNTIVKLMIFVLAVGMTLGSCDRQSEQEPDLEAELTEEAEMTENRQKMDAPLRAELRKLDAAEDNGMISFMLELNQDPTDDLREKMTDAGVEIRTEHNRILTARGGADAVRKLSMMDEVKRIEMAQRVSPREED